jgi:hypothetical protein
MKDDETLRAKVGSRIYDDVPSNEPMPYIKISDITEVPANTLNSRIKDITLTLNVWSDYGGNREVFDIMAIITSLFEYHHQTLNDTMATLASLDTSITNNFTCFYSAVEYSQVIEQGAFRHGILRFRMRVRLNDQ